MQPHDARGRGALHAQGLHKGLLLDHHRTRAHDSRHTGRIDDGERDDDVPHARPHHGHECDGQKHARNGHKAVADAHEDMIEPLVVARIGADHQAERTRRERDGNADAKRHARARDDAGKQVAAKVIAAKGMRGRRYRKSQRHLLRIGINRPHQRTDERDQRNRQENAAADHKPLVGKSLLNVCHHASPHLRARGSKAP